MSTKNFWWDQPCIQ